MESRNLRESRPPDTSVTLLQGARALYDTSHGDRGEEDVMRLERPKLLEERRGTGAVCCAMS